MSMSEAFGPQRSRQLREATIGVFCRDVSGKPECDGTGLLLDNSRCRCWHRFRQIVGYARANIPAKYWDYEFDKLNAEVLKGNVSSIEVLRSYSDTIEKQVAEGLGLYIYGTGGVGKSTLAYLIARAATDKGVLTYCTTMQQLIEDLKREIDDDDPVFVERMQRLRTDLQLLVIDEIDESYRAHPEGWTSHQLYAFFNLISSQRRSLVVTAKIPLSSLCHDMNTPVNAHLEELVPVQIIGKNIRYFVSDVEKTNRILILAGKPAVSPTIRKGKKT